MAFSSSPSEKKIPKVEEVSLYPWPDNTSNSLEAKRQSMDFSNTPFEKKTPKAEKVSSSPYNNVNVTGQTVSTATPSKDPIIPICMLSVEESIEPPRNVFQSVTNAELVHHKFTGQLFEKL